MITHHHHPGSAGGAAPGPQPAHLGNATRRAAAVTRPAQATSQAGRPASPGRDMNARSGRPRRAQRSPAASSLRSGLRRQTASARPRNWTAAQCIIETPERPARRPAINPGHPLTLSQLPRLLQDAALVYGLARVRTNGTVGNRGTAKALRWRHADRLSADLTAGAIVLRPSPRGRIGVQQDLRLTIPAAACRSRGIKTGDYVLFAAAPAHRLRLLIIHSMRAVDELPTVLDAALSAASPAASAVVYPAGGRGKGQAMNRPEDLAVPTPRSKGGSS